jgi:hypothetical protein
MDCESNAQLAAGGILWPDRLCVEGKIRFELLPDSTLPITNATSVLTDNEYQVLVLP